MLVIVAHKNVIEFYFTLLNPGDGIKNRLFLF